MPDHPVIAAYRGPDSSGAIQLGTTLARALGRELVLASAYRYEPVVLGPAEHDRVNERGFDAAQERLDRARTLAGADLDVREEVVAAEVVPSGLTELARDLDATLLVLGRDIAGHVTRSVLEQAPCPIAVSPFSVPLPRDEGRPRRIGVAYDGSPAARCALTAATRLAIASGAALRVIAVAADGARADAAAEAVAHAGDVADAEPEILRGRPGPALVAASGRLDLLACGSHGRGRVLAAVLGSVSAHLVAGAHCPVLVVPPHVRRRPAGPLGLTTAAG